MATVGQAPGVVRFVEGTPAIIAAAAEGAARGNGSRHVVAAAVAAAVRSCMVLPESTGAAVAVPLDAAADPVADLPLQQRPSTAEAVEAPLHSSKGASTPAMRVVPLDEVATAPSCGGVGTAACDGGQRMKSTHENRKGVQKAQKGKHAVPVVSKEGGKAQRALGFVAGSADMVAKTLTAAIENGVVDKVFIDASKGYLHALQIVRGKFSELQKVHSAGCGGSG